MRVYINKLNNLYHKLSKTLTLIAVFVLFSAKLVFAQEITAIDFNGDLIGKVIPDGKVVSFDNQLIGNINADSLIVGFDGELIGGIVPQGIAIGNDNKLLGKVNNDGTVRLASGKVVGKTLPNGLVVNDFFDITGFVLFPGLIYSDDGKTVGRLTGDGSYTNLQGQKIGFVSTDGYAYRKVGNDYVLDGKLISSKMVVSNSGEFVGSVSPGGEVTDFDSKIIGRIKANGYVYDPSNAIIGGIVSAGYAFDNKGKYLGFINYNGEVVNKEQLIGRFLSTGDIADLNGNVIGFSVDFATTFTDLNGKYIGRLIPNGKVVKNKEVLGELTSRALVTSQGEIIGSSFNTGPVFDYKGFLIAHAQRSGSVVLFEGTPFGNMKNSLAYNKSGEIIGATISRDLAVDLNNNILGISNISSFVGSDEDKSRVSPFGYVFNSEGKILGSSLKLGALYDLSGIIIAYVSPNGEVINKGSKIAGKLSSTGIYVNDTNRVLGKTSNAKYITGSDGKSIGYLSSTNIVFDKDKKVVGKSLPDGAVIRISDEKSSALMPKIGQSYEEGIVIGTTGNFIGYVGLNGSVKDASTSIVGQVIERGLVLDNNGVFLGGVLSYNAVVDNNCEFFGVVTPKGDIRNYRDIYIGKSLLNGQVISDSGSKIGHVINKGSVIDNNGNMLGISGFDGKALNYAGESLGCADNNGVLKNSEGTAIAKISFSEPVISFDGKIIGRTTLVGTIAGDKDDSIGYIQSNLNANSKTGVPLGNVFKYKFAFDNSNKFLGVILEDATVLGAGNVKKGKVDFNGQVNLDGEKIGYALYDLYVYDNNSLITGYIARDGNVLSFSGQNIGKFDRGFVIDRTGVIIARGSRDYSIRNEINTIIGELQLNGSLLDMGAVEAGKINLDTGIIYDNNESNIARAHPLQYYGKSIGTKPVYDENSNIIGYVSDDGSIVNEDGKIIALLNDNGFAISANGDIIGGIGSDWYEKAPKKKKREDGDFEVGVIDGSNIQEKSKKSFAVALTPDGEFLGNILEDGRVVDKEGRVLGRKMPDGLIIDDSGGLIGIEETVKPDFGGGVFIPANSFGQGSAYGTGLGAGGNLGPGGGFGPGERYDPQRSAALSAAQDERRKNIDVGKISTHVSKSSFDGMQPDWEEQGIGKTISSWRVNLSEMILADKPIPAVISRSIDSSHPTPVTAVVERNVYAEEGRNIIIPAGSRVIGELGSMSAGSESTSQSAKVDITWTRLIRPDGSIFRFESSLTGDAQGRGGALGYLDQQLFKKYSLPVLTTALTSMSSYMMAPSDKSEGETETPKQQAASDARQNFLTSMNRIFEQILDDKTNIKPLTYVPAGTRIIIFPMTDLWLRTAEREELEANSNFNKKDILIDDKKSLSERDTQELKRKLGQTGGGNSIAAGSGGSVVYEPDDGDIEASPTLIKDTPKKPKDKSKTPGVGSVPPPPPPPSTYSGTTVPADTGSSTTTSNIPQLF